MKKEQLYNLLEKVQSGTASKEEINLVEAWMLLSEANGEDITPAELEAAKTRIWGKLAVMQGVTTEPEPVPVIRRSFSWLKYAAVFTLAFAAGLLAFLSRHRITDFFDPAEMMVVQTEAHEIRQVVLPDSSLVTLAANSKLMYPARFSSGSRDVSMEGKLFFDVRPDKSKPFRIKTEEVYVKVLGTSFEVNNKTGNDTATVTVVTGKVSVDNAASKGTIVLPNQQVVLNKKTNNMELRQVTETDNYTQWLQYVISFDETVLTEAFEKLSRTFNTVIRLDASAIKHKETFTGAFNRKESLEDILDIICISSGLQWKKAAGNVITIYR